MRKSTIVFTASFFFVLSGCGSTDKTLKSSAVEDSQAKKNLQKIGSRCIRFNGKGCYLSIGIRRNDCENSRKRNGENSINSSWESTGKRTINQNHIKLI